MAAQLTTETIPQSLYHLNQAFAGRNGSRDYNESALIHIHRRNRAYVWNQDMRVKLIDSILKGYPLPPIFCCSLYENGRERRYIMDGGNRVTTIRMILNGEVRELTDDEKRRVENFTISLVVMRNFSNHDLRTMFRRLNKNVKVSDGQLFAMSVEDSPLIREAHALLTDPDHPLRDRITACFKDTRRYEETDKSRSDLANAVAIVSGILHGPHFITKSYNAQDEHVDRQEVLDRDQIVRVFGSICEIFHQADLQSPIRSSDRKKQWSVGKYIGPMIYDYLCHSDRLHQIREKWIRFIVRTRDVEHSEISKSALKLEGAQNLTASHHAKVSAKVQIYLTTGRLATNLELAQYDHRDLENNSDSDVDAEEEEENAGEQ